MFELIQKWIFEEILTSELEALELDYLYEGKLYDGTTLRLFSMYRENNQLDESNIAIADLLYGMSSVGVWFSDTAHYPEAPEAIARCSDAWWKLLTRCETYPATRALLSKDLARIVNWHERGLAKELNKDSGWESLIGYYELDKECKSSKVLADAAVMWLDNQELTLEDAKALMSSVTN